MKEVIIKKIGTRRPILLSARMPVKYLSLLTSQADCIVKKKAYQKRQVVTLLFLLLFCSVSIHADSDLWLWPIEGQKAGDNILYQPQTYIGDEHVFYNLFIGAPYGSVVVAPVDGTIILFGLYYNYSLAWCRGGSIERSKSFEERAREMAAQIGKNCDPKFINYMIGIRLTDGRKMYMSGLKIDREFKTGEKIKRGEKIGTVHYSYKKINEPSINLSVDKRGGGVDDPMTPFGIKTSFIPPQARKPITKVTAEEAKEDFNILMDAFIECYPSLDDLISREELEAYRQGTLKTFTGTMPILDFYKVMEKTCALLHDSHLNLYPLENDLRKQRYADIELARCGDDIVVFSSTPGFEKYVRRKVTAIDGISADSILRHTARFARDYDAQAEDYIKYYQAGELTRCYLNYFDSASPEGNFTVTFEDGETLAVKSHSLRKGSSNPILTWNYVYTSLINRYSGSNYSLKKLNDSTAYIGLSTFQLNEKEVEEVRDFIAGQQHTPHMIVDVRNNRGGDGEVLTKILSYLSDKPYAETEGYSKVNKRGNFRSFKYTLNYQPQMEDIFGEEHQPLEGKDGLYAFHGVSRITPDSAVQYSGKLYVLINEMSCSAATLFPAIIMRSHRGVLVGRETRTAYHYMTALKFADMCLPHSRITWHIPLVKCVFDQTENPRVPYGRGVIPDYCVPLTKDEIFIHNDGILERALKLIADGEYLGDNPFVEKVMAENEMLPFELWIGGTILLCLVIILTRNVKSNAGNRIFLRINHFS